MAAILVGPPPDVVPSVPAPRPEDELALPPQADIKRGTATRITVMRGNFLIVPHLSANCDWLRVNCIAAYLRAPLAARDRSKGLRRTGIGCSTVELDA